MSYFSFLEFPFLIHKPADFKTLFIFMLFIIMTDDDQSFSKTNSLIEHKSVMPIQKTWVNLLEENNCSRQIFHFRPPLIQKAGYATVYLWEYLWRIQHRYCIFLPVVFRRFSERITTRVSGGSDYYRQRITKVLGKWSVTEGNRVSEFTPKV